MKITDKQLGNLINENLLEYEYNTSITNSNLEKVVMYIDCENHLVDVWLNRCGIFEIDIWVGEEKVNLTDLQVSQLYDRFQVYFASKEASDADSYFNRERAEEAEDYVKYYK